MLAQLSRKSSISMKLAESSAQCAQKLPPESNGMSQNSRCPACSQMRHGCWPSRCFRCMAECTHMSALRCCCIHCNDHSIKGFKHVIDSFCCSAA